MIVCLFDPTCRPCVWTLNFRPIKSHKAGENRVLLLFLRKYGKGRVPMEESHKKTLEEAVGQRAHKGKIATG